MSRITHIMIAFTLAAGTAAAGCADLDEGVADEPVGSVEVPLRIAAAGAGHYRLVDAVFLIRDEGGGTVAEIDGTGNGLTAQFRVPEGNYSIELGSGWGLMIEVEGQLYPAGDFVIDGPNPRPISVTQGKTSKVTYAFKRSGTVFVGIEPPDRLVAGYVTFDASDTDMPQFGMNLAGTAGAFTWDIGRLTQTTPGGYEIGEDVFAWAEGTSPGILASMQLPYETTALTRGMTFTSSPEGVRVDVHVEWWSYYYIVTEHYRLELSGIVPSPALDGTGVPLAAPFCIDEGEATFARTWYGQAQATGYAAFCFE